MYRLLLLLYFLTIVWCQAPGEDPEFVLIFDSPIYVCPDDDSVAFMNTGNVEATRYNESVAYMTGHITFLKSMGEEITMIELIIYKEANGREEVVFTYEICDLCEEIGDVESMLYKYLKYFGFPDECPFEAGDYKIDDLVADTEELPINSANAGKYSVVLNILNDPQSTCKSEKATFLACAKFNFLIEMASK